tara:strand:- start:16091 stop:16354 length:264 start_codon:yes stop_codon:yes gene_type:complete
MPGFFGLNQTNRKKVFQEVFDLTYHGKGGFPHSEVYNMPVWMRRAYINYINNYNELQQKEIDKRQMQNKDISNNPKDVFRPNISPKS